MFIMKIALVIYQYSDSKGGVERYVSDLTKGLIKLGHEVHIFCHKRDEPSPKGVTFHYVPATSALYRAFKMLSFANNAAKLLQAEKFDIIQGFGRTYYQDILRFGSGCHWEYLKHTHPSMNSPIGRFIQRINPRNIAIMNMERKSFQPGSYKKIICISNMVKKEIQYYYGIQEKDTTVIHNAVDLGRFTPDNRARYRETIRKELGIADNEIAVLFVGSGFERKGLAYAIEALSLISDTRFKLIVIGKGNESKYKLLAERKGVCDRVLFLGSKENIERYYAASDIFIFPSLYDAFGTAVLEAMASGLPVLVSNQSGASEVVNHDKDAYIINPKDTPEIARYLNELSNQGKREEMGKSAYETSQKYSFQSNLESVLKVYGEVIKSK